jgi:hypothetical protein
MWLTQLIQRAKLEAAERAICSALSPVREGAMGSYSAKNGYGARGPTLGDCQRLWDTLVTEYVTDLAISIDFQTAKEPAFIARVAVWSPGLDPETGGPHDHVWATKEIAQGYEAITYVQLYDLLIQSYRNIQHHLGGQTPMPMP